MDHYSQFRLNVLKSMLGAGHVAQIGVYLSSMVQFPVLCKVGIGVHICNPMFGKSGQESQKLKIISSYIGSSWPAWARCFGSDKNIKPIAQCWVNMHL